MQLKSLLVLAIVASTHIPLQAALTGDTSKKANADPETGAAVKFQDAAGASLATFVPSTMLPTLYLATGEDQSADAKPDAAQTYYVTAAQVSQGSVSLTGLTPAKVQLGDVLDQPNPIVTAKGVAKMTVAGGYPVVAVNGVNDKLYAIANTNDGSAVVAAGVKDTAGGNPDSIAALAAGPSNVFAAVTNNGVGDWTAAAGAKDRGIAVLSNTAGTISQPQNAMLVDFSKDQAVGLDGSDAAFGADTETISMNWNNNLGALYAGLNVQGTGVCGVVFSKDLNTINRAVGPTIKSADLADAIIGGPAVNHAIIRSMGTSTKNNYLISKTKVGVAKGVFAQPLTTDGFLAAVTPATGVAVDFATAPVKAADLLKVAAPKAPAKVAPNLAIHSDNSDVAWDNISDVFVEGDSVYLTLNDATAGNNTRRGIFKSSALFNDKGAIIGWTPAERVSGVVDITNAAGIDTVTGNVYALTGADNNTVKITQWGSDDGRNLKTAVADKYSKETAGIHNITVLNEATKGFDNGDAAKNSYEDSTFSMMLVQGYDNVSLVQTGRGVGPAYVITTDFTGKALQLADNDSMTALKAIAPITSADVSRDGGANSGYVFAGGWGGVAVLSKSVDGKGYGDALGSINSAKNAFPGDGTEANPYKFTQLKAPAGVDFSNVRKVSCFDRFTYVMTDKKLYAFNNVSTPGFFKAVGPTALVVAATFDFSAHAALADAYLNDMVVLRSAGAGSLNGLIILLATTKGLFVVKGNAPAPADIAKVNSDDLPALQLQYLSLDKQGPAEIGNLFVLFGNPGSEPSQGVVRRYNIDNKAATAVADVAKLVGNAGKEEASMNTFDFGNYRANLYSDGNIVVTTCGKHLDDETYVRSTALRSSLSPQNVDGNVIRNGYAAGGSTSPAFVGTPVADASGMIMIPGQWGVRVNG